MLSDPRLTNFNFSIVYLVRQQRQRQVCIDCQEPYLLLLRPTYQPLGVQVLRLRALPTQLGVLLALSELTSSLAQACQPEAAQPQQQNYLPRLHQLLIQLR